MHFRAGFTTQDSRLHLPTSTLQYTYTLQLAACYVACVCVELACRGRGRDTCIAEQECTDRNTAWASAGDRCGVLTGTFFASITSANVLRSSHRYQAHRRRERVCSPPAASRQPPIPDQTVVNPTNKPS